MQPVSATLDARSETLQMGPTGLRIIVAGLVLAAIGIVVALTCGFGHEYAPSLFLHAYLLAFVFYLTITLGSLFFVILHHLARAGWSVTLRRLAEMISCNVFLLAVLFVPIVYYLDNIYSWANPKSADYQASADAKKGDDVKKEDAKQGAAATGKEKAGEAAGESELSRTGHLRWLTRKNFIGRFCIYFIIWGFLAWYFRGHSVLQDSTGSVRLSRSMDRLSGPAMILFAFTLTGAAFDLIMSLNPHWYSTMIGVYLFADTVLSSLVVITLLSLWLQTCGLLRGVVTKEHYHDLGKLIFSFIVFWGYIAFSQYMLIWYANVPEETQFFMPRQIGPWAGISLALIVVHFVIPFFGLISRHVKRALPLFAFWLIWLLVAHAFDLFWLIMPNVYIQQIPVYMQKVGTPPETAALLPKAFPSILESQQSVYQVSPNADSLMNVINAPLQAKAIATVIGLLLFMGGLFMASTAWMLQGAALTPLKDPRLDEALSFHNT
jgi:hypothetical protein